MNNRELANFIWSIADLLRGDYKQAEYGKIILPFTMLRRLDCVLEKTRKRFWKNTSQSKSSMKRPWRPSLIRWRDITSTTGANLISKS